MPKRPKRAPEEQEPVPRPPGPEVPGAKRRGRGRPRLGKPVARHLPRDEEILRIAAVVFHRKGYEATKVEDVAREAGLVRGSIYNYFRTKEDLYRKILQERILLILDLLHLVQRQTISDIEMIRQSEWSVSLMRR